MKKISLLMIFLIFPAIVFAGITGKITGIVTDVKTGEALPGANVIIEGTMLGAATDTEGLYVILNVPAGTHRLRASMMGYATHIVTEVRVNIDLTTVIDLKMEPVILPGEEVLVVAERPIVQKDVTGTRVDITSRQIEALPVTSVREVLGYQAGIERGREGIIIRGGSANQTAFMVDGLLLSDGRSNIPYTAVSLSSVKEIQIQTGGFNAEYGNVRSGIVNVVTKEGPRDHYSGTITVRYSPPTPKHFGPSIYDPYSYFNRPYMDPDVCWTGTINGAWDGYTQRQYPRFEGWNAVSERTLADDDPTNDLTPEGAKRLYEWQHRRQGDIKKPDYNIDLGFGGPVPYIGKKLGNLRFYLSYFRGQDMFIFPLSRDYYAENHTRLRLSSDLTPSTKLTFTGLYGEIHSVSPYNWKITPTGRVLRTPWEIANLLNSGTGNSILYMPGYYSPSSISRSMFGANLTHMLTPKTFYEISFQYNTNRYNTHKIADRDTTRKYEPIPGYFVDEAPYGYFGYGDAGICGMSMGGWMNLGRDKSINSTTSFSFDLTSQINLRNQIKTGIKIVYNDFNIKSFTESPSMNTWTRNMVYNVSPLRVGVYIQNKLEYEGLIANVGLRLDHSYPNTKLYQLKDYDKYLSAGYGNLIETEVPLKNSKASWSLSPRLGVSHPITENSKLYFNYGHFYSEPASSYRFRLQREASGLVTYMGDPNLTPEKTVAYELGVSQNLLDIFLLNIAAYYKNVTEQQGWIFYQNIDRSVQYYKAANNNYEDIRGFEVTLSKHTGRWVTGFVNYTYDVQTSGYFGSTIYFEDPGKQRDYLRLHPYQERTHPRPYARANINFHTPDNFGPEWKGMYPFGSCNLNILAEWITGRYSTYNPYSLPGVVDNVQWKDRYSVDLRSSKLVRIGKHNFQFFLDIANVLNIKQMTYAGFSDRHDYLDYMSSLNFSWEEGVEHGNDRIGDYRPEDVAYDPLEPNLNNDSDITARNDRRKRNKSYIDMPNFKSLTFLNPRKITFGIKLDF